MPSEEVLRHEERPRPGTTVQFSLTPDGLAKEEFTSGVLTHSHVVDYGEVWDTYRTQTFPAALFWRLLLMSGVWAGAAFLAPASWGPLALAGAALGSAWVLLAWRSRLVTVEVYDYDGYELAVFHGAPAPAFRAFLDAFQERIARSRYPMQSFLESMDLGHCLWQRWGIGWKCSFLYDRVVLETRGPLGHERRHYYSLSSLEPPIHLAWRVPWAALGLWAVAGLPAAVLARDAAGSPDLRLVVLALAGVTVAAIVWAVLALGVAIEVSVGGHPVRSPVLPWWQRGERRRILLWYARLLRLADLLADLREEDYWEYHRTKLSVLKDEGFLEDWPYRSALSRLNSQERQDTGE